MRKILVAATLSLSLAACAQNGTSPDNTGGWGMNKQTGGAVIGAVGGGLAGSQFGHGTGNLAMTALGTVVGALVGSEVGKSLDRADVAYANKTGQNALETAKTGQTVSWANPDSGHSGTVTPTRTYESAPGQYCREYQQTITVGGKQEQSYGTACRQPDGSWKVTN